MASALLIFFRLPNLRKWTGSISFDGEQHFAEMRLDIIRRGKRLSVIENLVENEAAFFHDEDLLNS